MPVLWLRCRGTWRERLGATPGESRGHAEMRARRRRRKQLRKLAGA